MPTARSDSLIGKTVAGNFLLESLIGEGAMGRVFLAHQLSLDKQVAIKVLHRHLAGERNMARRFHREARAASRLNHPNSLHIIDFGQTDDNTLYIAMEYIEGMDLLDLLEQDYPLGVDRIVDLVGQVCGALDEAHVGGIVHRDLKPENIMVIRRRDGEELIKVCDFGIAKIQEARDGESLAPITVAGIVCGTPEFMSPEQGKGEELDGRSDIYSLGVILYQLATLELPFTADTALGVVTRHLTEDPVPPSHVAPNAPEAAALEGIILRCLSKNPDARYTSALDLKQDLERVRQGERVTYSTLPVTPTPPAGRRPLWPLLVSSVAVAAALIIGVGAVLWTSREDPTLVLVEAPPPTKVAAPGELDASLSTAGDGAAEEGDAADPSDGGAKDSSPGFVAAMPTPAPAKHVKRGPRKTTVTKTKQPPRQVPPTKADTAGPSSYEQGQSAFRSGNIREAITRFEAARGESPGSSRVHRMLGKCYYRAGRISQGKAAYRRYLDLRPNAPDKAFIESIIGGS